MRSAAKAVVAALVVTTLLTGCARSQRNNGAGDKVDFCAAYKVYDSLPEPSPGDPQAVTAYADSVVRVVDRVDAQERVDRAELPKEVISDLAVLKKGMRSFKAAYRAAGADVAKRRAAEGGLATDAAVDTAGRRLTTFFLAHCKRKANVPGAVTPNNN